jgi:hypothetical protein
MKKIELTTKDLGALKELITFEQWAATKFKHYFDMIEEEDLKELFESISIAHSERRDALMEFLTTNAPSSQKEGD